MADLLTHPLLGLDSTSAVSPAAHKAVGSSFAVRYLSRNSWKVVTRAEADDLKKHGLNLVLVFEDGAVRPRDGHQAGVDDLTFARNQAKDILGVVPQTIYFAYDTDPSGGIPATVDEYFDAVRQGGGPYGGFDLVAHLGGRGFNKLWQTYAWSRGLKYGPAGLYQYSNGHVVGGVGVDLDHAFHKDFGQLWQPPVDTKQYHKFDSTRRFLHGRWISELGRMKHLDTLLAEKDHNSALHKDRLNETEKEIRWLFERLWRVVHTDQNGDPIPTDDPRAAHNWTLYNRGWRGKQLWNASKGQR